MLKAQVGGQGVPRLTLVTLHGWEGGNGGHTWMSYPRVVTSHSLTLSGD